MAEGKNDGQNLTIGEVLQEIRWLLNTTPKGDWVWMHQKFEADEENDLSESEVMLGWVFENLAYGEEGQLHGVQIANTGQLVALTGNGPNSRRYARLLMLVHAALPLILQMLEEAGKLELAPNDPDWRPSSAPCDGCGSCENDSEGERMHDPDCPQAIAVVHNIKTGAKHGAAFPNTANPALPDDEDFADRVATPDELRRDLRHLREQHMALALKYGHVKDGLTIACDVHAPGHPVPLDVGQAKALLAWNPEDA